jgi:hypothetical protein
LLVIAATFRSGARGFALSAIGLAAFGANACAAGGAGTLLAAGGDADAN